MLLGKRLFWAHTWLKWRQEELKLCHDRFRQYFRMTLVESKGLFGIQVPHLNELLSYIASFICLPFYCVTSVEPTGTLIYLDREQFSMGNFATNKTYLNLFFFIPKFCAWYVKTTKNLHDFVANISSENSDLVQRAFSKLIDARGFILQNTLPSRCN